MGNIQELSKGTLKRYIKKASTEREQSSAAADSLVKPPSHRWPYTKNINRMPEWKRSESNRLIKKAVKRSDGISSAKERLGGHYQPKGPQKYHTEDVGNIQELFGKKKGLKKITKHWMGVSRAAKRQVDSWHYGRKEAEYNKASAHLDRANTLKDVQDRRGTDTEKSTRAWTMRSQKAKHSRSYNNKSLQKEEDNMENYRNIVEQTKERNPIKVTDLVKEQLVRVGIRKLQEKKQELAKIFFVSEEKK